MEEENKKGEERRVGSDKKEGKEGIEEQQFSWGSKSS